MSVSLDVGKNADAYQFSGERKYNIAKEGELELVGNDYTICRTLKDHKAKGRFTKACQQ